MNFKEIKKLYVEARENEKIKIIDYLLKENFIILNMEDKEATNPHKTGSGIKNYTSGKRIHSYDLSNWKWIFAEKNNIKYLVLLQSFDKDPKTKNRHILMDRIGIYRYSNLDLSKESIAQGCFDNLYNTGIDLPMDDDKLCKLCNMLEKLNEDNKIIE